MFAFLGADQNFPFMVALGLMAALALLEGVGLLLGAGLSQLLERIFPSVDLDVDGPDVDSPGVISQILGWFHIGWGGPHSLDSLGAKICKRLVAVGGS
ncbi:MAG: hypothetical protein COX57_00005, partial [Alphaproteobacteria bacterium CG_4_10_14_0_2_um_filter_63_37]